MKGSQVSKGRRDGTFSSLLSAVRAQREGGRRSASSGPPKWAKPHEPQAGGTQEPPQPQGSRIGSLHPRFEPGHARARKAPEKLPDVDNEGRPFNLKLVVINFNNVGTKYGIDVLNQSKPSFNWEGVRLCVKEMAKRKFKIIGVIYQNWTAYDGKEWVQGIPEDIKKLCDSIQETPKIMGEHQRSADDEMTIKCAYRRNCCIMDNDNYQDWLKRMRKDEVRHWYEHSKERIHMRYYFDTDLRTFETLDGNALRGASEEREEKPKSRNRFRQRAQAEEGQNQRPSWSAPTPEAPEAPSTLGSAMMVPTETGFRKHKGPTITMPTSMTSRSAPNTVDLTVEPSRRSKDLNGLTAGWTALCTAAQQGKVQSVSRLLEAKADPNVSNSMGAHPLFYAVSNWSLRMFRLLEKHGAKIERARSEKGESLKAYAERKVTQAAAMKRFGAAYFASASCQELLRAVGARKGARAALAALASSEAARAKRRRADGRATRTGRIREKKVRSSAPPSLDIPAQQDPYGGVNNSDEIDLTADWDMEPPEAADAIDEVPDPVEDMDLQLALQRLSQEDQEACSGAEKE